MDDDFEISIMLNGKELTYKAIIITTGYSHKVVVSINDMEVSYEPDEERNYRILINGEAVHKIRESDVEIIKAVGEKLQDIVDKG